MSIICIQRNPPFNNISSEDLEIVLAETKLQILDEATIIQIDTNELSKFVNISTIVDSFRIRNQ